MKQVLMVSPHFPPDTSAATHRVRLLAPHLQDYGWLPTILTVDPRGYEGRLDLELEGVVPKALRLIRVRAWSHRWTRILGVGDLGLRSFWGLYRTCRDLLANERFDVFFVTIFPTYPALLGPLIKRRSRIRFVLDYIDPWVGAWGQTTGAGKDGSPDLKSRLSRRLAEVLEPVAVRAADGVTAVSEGTYDLIQERVPELASLPRVEIPYGGEAADFDYLRSHPREPGVFHRADGKFHLSYVGTLLPLGRETLRAFLAAVALLKQRNPQSYSRFRAHFVGTSNQTSLAVHNAVIPEACRLGVEDVIDEIPLRLDYFDALNVLVSSDAVLLLGSSERHYTASKLYPALLARRPLLAMYHGDSSVVTVLRRSTRPPTVRLITYDDENRAESRVEGLYDEITSLLDRPFYDPTDVDLGMLEEYSARSIAGRLARLFDEITASS